MIRFKRNFNPINRIYMDKMYGETMKIEKLSRHKLANLYKNEPKALVDNYLFYLLDKWIQKNYVETVEFANKLKRIIKRLKLPLNTVEYDKLLILDERIFSIERHIKVLEVAIQLDKKESAGAKFSPAKLFLDGSFISDGDLILTNKRMIFDGEALHSFYYNVANITKNDNHIDVKYRKRKYQIYIHDNITLINTLNNVRRKAKKHEI